MPKPRLTNQQAEQLAEQKWRAEHEITGCPACDKEQEQTRDNCAMCKNCLIGYLEYQAEAAKAALAEAKNDNSRA